MLSDLSGADALNESDLSETAKSYIEKLKELEINFGDSLDDDFNTAQALGYVFEAVRLLNSIFVTKKGITANDKRNILQVSKKLFDHFGFVLGIFQHDPDNYFITDKEKELSKRGLDINQIETLVEERKTARQAKNWARADEIRNQLARMNVVLKDTNNTTTWIIE
jgi:cysteinyl-tRNA synthetase